MTNLPTRKGPTPGTVVVNIADIEAWEQRWQETRDNQVKGMNNLLAKIEELQSQQGQDAVAIAELTAELGGLGEQLREVEALLGRTTEERDAALSAVRIIQGVIATADLTQEGDSLSGPALVEWQLRLPNAEPEDEAIVGLMQEDGTVVPKVSMPRGEERPSTGFGTSGNESSGRHAGLT